MRRLYSITATIGAFILVPGCVDRADAKHSYSLYRASPIDPNMRIHIASFDSQESSQTEAYNAENCRIAAELFMKQSGVTVRYWCEKGRARK